MSFLLIFKFVKFEILKKKLNFFVFLTNFHIFSKYFFLILVLNWMKLNVIWCNNDYFGDGDTEWEQQYVSGSGFRAFDSGAAVPGASTAALPPTAALRRPSAGPAHAEILHRQSSSVLRQRHPRSSGRPQTLRRRGHSPYQKKKI